MENKEVEITLKANVDPFKASLEDAIDNIEMAKTDMTTLNAIIDNCGSKQLKNIASKLQDGINDATDSVKVLEQELLKLNNTGNFDNIQKIQDDITIAKNEVSDLAKELSKAMASGESPEKITELKNELNDAKKVVNEMQAELRKQVINIQTNIPQVKGEIEETTALIDNMKQMLNTVTMAQGSSEVQSMNDGIANLQTNFDNVVASLSEGIIDMTTFDALLSVAENHELGDITLALRSGLENTELELENLRIKLLEATSSGASPEAITIIKKEIEDATKKAGIFKSALDKVKDASASSGGTGINIFGGLSRMLDGVRGMAERVVNTFKRMVISSAIMGIIGSIRKGLSDACQLSSSATNKFTAMGNIIAGTLIPVVDAFATAVRRAFVWVAGLINFLTGGKVNIIQKGIDATNKKIGKLTTSTKTAGKSAKKMADGLLSGLDEINNIKPQESSGGGSSGGGGGADLGAQTGALGELQKMLEEMNALDFSWAQPLKDVLDWIGQNWQILVAGLAGLVAGMIAYNVICALTTLATGTLGLSLGTLISIIAAVALGVAGIVAVIMGVVELFKKGGNETKAWTLILGGLLAIVVAIGLAFGLVPMLIAAVVAAVVAGVLWVIKHFEEVKTFISGVLTAIGQFFVDLWTGIKTGLSDFFTAWKTAFQTAWTTVVGIFQGIGRWFGDRFNDIIGFFKNIPTKMKGFFQTAWTNISNIFKGIGKWFGDRFNDIINFFKNLPSKLKEFFQKAYTNVTNIFKGIGGWFGNRVSDIVGFFKDLPTKVYKFVKSLYDKITTLFSKIGKAVGDTVSGAVKGAINAVLKTGVSIINGFIRAINLAISVINAIPGVNITKLSLLEVPSFDVGTNYVPEDMLAMVHKGERITPAKYNNDDWVGEEVDMSETNDLLQTLIDIVASKNLTIDGKDIGRASVNYILAENRRRGASII